LSCHGQHIEASLKNNPDDDHVLLGLVGYNYTDRDIENYSVNGAGGGSVNLSSSTSGGSGVTCCVRLSKSQEVPFRVKIRWQVDGCKYLIKDDRTGKVDSIRHFYYKETEVDVYRNDGEDPKYIETHFYPDGTVKVKLVEQAFRPLLLLDGDRPDKSSFPICKNDEKPNN